MTRLTFVTAALLLATPAFAGSFVLPPPQSVEHTPGGNPGIQMGQRSQDGPGDFVFTISNFGTGLEIIKEPGIGPCLLLSPQEWAEHGPDPHAGIIPQGTCGQ